MKKKNECDITFYKKYAYYVDLNGLDAKLLYRFVNDYSTYKNKLYFARKFGFPQLVEFYCKKSEFAFEVYKEFLQQIIDKYQLDNFDETDWEMATEKMRIYYNEKS